MSARFVQGDANITLPMTVATAQAVEVYDLVALAAGTIVRASDEVYGTTIATPSAPTVADSGVNIGTALTNAATGVKVSMQFPWGEGALSSAGSATPTAGGMLKVTLAALSTPALWWNVYVETAAASGTYKLVATSPSGSILYVTSYGVGRTPPTAITTTDLQITQFNFAQHFAGVSNQRKVANLARIFGNSADNQIMVCRGGIWEFDCVSASFAVGDWVGAAKDTTSALLNQTVVAVADSSLAIGRVHKAATSVTKVLVEVKSTFDMENPRFVDLANASPA